MGGQWAAAPKAHDALVLQFAGTHSSLNSHLLTDSSIHVLCVVRVLYPLPLQLWCAPHCHDVHHPVSREGLTGPDPNHPGEAPATSLLLPHSLPRTRHLAPATSHPPPHPCHLTSILPSHSCHLILPMRLGHGVGHPVRSVCVRAARCRASAPACHVPFRADGVGGHPWRRVQDVPEARTRVGTRGGVPEPWTHPGGCFLRGWDNWVAYLHACTMGTGCGSRCLLSTSPFSF